ncbi:hypothetical protein ACOME3_001327 [Neoechinorhynchus agilis]
MLPWLRRNQIDELSVALVTNVAVGVLYAIGSTSRPAISIIPFVGMLSELTIVSVRHRLASIYHPNIHQSIFNFLAILETCSVLLGTFIFTGLYSILPSTKVWTLFLAGSLLVSTILAMTICNGKKAKLDDVSSDDFSNQNCYRIHYESTDNFYYLTDHILF